MRTYTKYPYRTQFPDSSESGRNSQTLEDALCEARSKLYRVWRETTEYGVGGEYIYDTETAVITNRNTGYRWILRRKDRRVEFQTSEMFEEAVGGESIEVHLTVEEAEALARAAASVQIKDRREKALTDQALDQIAIVCRQVRRSVRDADEFIDSWTRGIPRRPPTDAEPVNVSPGDEPAAPRPRYRPLGDPDNLTLKEAGEILGKARNTVYLWYRQGKFPPAVDAAPFLGGGSNKPVIVVPRYRLEAWQAGDRMPSILQEVFEFQGLHEPPWGCWVARKGASKEDTAFWVERRGWTEAALKTGIRIYGDALEVDRLYDAEQPLSDG
jgi:hypothetical protein